MTMHLEKINRNTLPPCPVCSKDNADFDVVEDSILFKCLACGHTEDIVEENKGTNIYE